MIARQLILLALAAALVSAVPAPQDFDDEEDSQLSLIPNNEGEVQFIKPDMEIFGEFCVTARDQVLNYLRTSVNSASAKVFTIMFNNINEIAVEALDVEKQTVAEGVEVIKNVHLAPPSEQPESRQEIADGIEKRVEEVKKSGLLETVKSSVAAVVQAAIATASSEAAKRLAYLKANFNGENAREKIDAACDDISYNLKRILNESLTKAKKELMASSVAPQIVYSAKLENIGCVTVGRVEMVNKFCSILKAVGPMVFPMMGM